MTWCSCFFCLSLYFVEVLVLLEPDCYPARWAMPTEFSWLFCRGIEMSCPKPESCFKMLLGLECSFIPSCYPTLAISPRSPGLFPRRMIFKTQDLGTGDAHCYWGATAPKSFQQTDLRNLCVCVNLCTHMHLSLLLCVFLCINTHGSHGCLQL